MVDIHSHIIPMIDDGAIDIDISILMLKKAEKTGTTKIILTPHYYRGKFIKTIKEVKEEVEKLKVLAKEKDIKIELYAGQEIYYTSSLLEYLEEGEIGTLNDTRYMLIEFETNKINKSAIDIIYELKFKGIKVIVTHPERYIEFQKSPSYINQFIEEGCLFQLNANSISGILGKETKKLAEIFLRNNIYSFIGSDAHSDGTRNTDIMQYKEKIESIKRNFLEIAKKNGENLLKNEEIKFEGEKIAQEKKGYFFKKIKGK